MYQIRKHLGLRNSMAHIYNGSCGDFSNLADAVAWAKFKHDKINNTFVCLDNGDVIYGLLPSGKSYETEAMQKHVAENPWLEWSTKHYTICKG